MLNLRHRPTSKLRIRLLKRGLAKDSTTVLEKIEDMNAIQQLNRELNFIIKDFLGCLSIIQHAFEVISLRLFSI